MVVNFLGFGIFRNLYLKSEDWKKQERTIHNTEHINAPEALQAIFHLMFKRTHD